MRTLLDSLIPAVEAMKACAADLSLKEIVDCATAAANQGMENTKEMKSMAGRSNYIDEATLKGIPDPGAYAVYLAFQAASTHF